MTHEYVLSADALRCLVDPESSGDDLVPALAVVRSAQASRRLLMLRAAVDAAMSRFPSEARRADLAGAVRALTRFQRINPGAAAQALGYPFVGPWLERLVRRTRPSTADPGPDLADDLAMVHQLSGRPPTRRRIVAGGAPLVLDITLDDSDAERDCYGVPPHPGLSGAEVERWTDTLCAAWTLLTRDHSGAARLIAEVVSVLTPLAPAPVGVSGSARAAFGAMAMTEPASPVSCCVSLVHEARHSVMNGLLDLVPLLDGDGGDFYSPWRSDPRPAIGLLHGAFAFLGVAEFWRRRSAATGDRAMAQYEYLRTREQVRVAVGSLTGLPELSPAGRHVIELLSAVLARWSADPADPVEAARADQALAIHRYTWRLHHVRPDHDDVVAAVEAWHSGRPTAPAVRAGLRPSDSVRFAADDWRLPGLHPDDQPGPGDAPGLARAARIYRERQAADPADHATWIGLAVTGGMITTRPEVVAAVCREALRRHGEPADPAAVAAWLGTAPDLADAQVGGGSMSHSSR